MSDDRPKTFRCPECGAENSESATFCGLCLTRFSEPEPQPSAEPQGLPEDAGPVDTSRPTEDTTTAGAGATDDDWAAGFEPFAPEAEKTEGVDELADLPLEVQLELKRPRDELDMRKVWLRAVLVVALGLVTLGLSMGILALMVRQNLEVQSTPGTAGSPTAPGVRSGPSPPATQSTQPSQDIATSHPDLSFEIPAGWTAGGTADDIVLRSSDGSMTIEIRSWARSPDGKYQFVGGRLQAGTRAAALREMAPQILDYAYGGTAHLNASATPANAGTVSAVMTEVDKKEEGQYLRAYGFVHDDWTYLASGTAPTALSGHLVRGMQEVLRSVSFKT